MKKLLPSVLLLSVFSSGFVVAGDDNDDVGTPIEQEKSEEQKLPKKIQRLLEELPRLFEYMDEDCALTPGRHVNYELSRMVDFVNQNAFDKARRHCNTLWKHPCFCEDKRLINVLLKIQNTVEELQQLQQLQTKLLSFCSYMPCDNETIGPQDALNYSLLRVVDHITTKKYLLAFNELYPLLCPPAGRLGCLTKDSEIFDILLEIRRLVIRQLTPKQQLDSLLKELLYHLPRKNDEEALIIDPPTSQKISNITLEVRDVVSELADE